MVLSFYTITGTKIVEVKRIPLIILCFATLASSHALANDTVSSTVNAKAGLRPILSLFCTDVNFGVWRVPVRTAGGTSSITLSVSANNASGTTTATVGGNAQKVAKASGYDEPTASVCTVNGANTTSATIKTAITDNTNLTFGGSTHNNLKSPSATAALSANLALAGEGVLINSTGAGTFRVVGTLTLPEAISADNYGGYATDTADGANAATVTVTDVENTTSSAFF